MKVTLLKDVNGLGSAGDEVAVKDGYAINLLIPQTLAAPVGSELANKIIQIKKNTDKSSKEHIQKLRIRAKRLKDREFTLSVIVGAKQQMFGSITKNDIAELVKVDKNLIKIDRPIKEVGMHVIPIDFGNGITTTVKLNVVAK